MQSQAVIKKWDKKLLFQSVTKIYYKVRQALQSASGITKCDRLVLQSASGITECYCYYNVRRNSFYQCEINRYSDFWFDGDHLNT